MTKSPLDQLERGLKKWVTDYQNLVEEVKDYDKRAAHTKLTEDLDFLSNEIGRINNWLDWLGEAAALIDAYAPQTPPEAERKREIVAGIATAGLTMINSRRRLRIAESTLGMRASRHGSM